MVLIVSKCGVGNCVCLAPSIYAHSVIWSYRRLRYKDTTIREYVNEINVFAYAEDVFAYTVNTET